MSKETFTITQHHLDLLRNAVLRWNDGEFGAPGIDPKCPYGNSVGIYSDIAAILHIKPEGDEDSFTADQEDQMRRMHDSTLIVLQIAIDTGCMAIGTYRRVSTEDGWRWVREDETVSDEADEPIIAHITAFIRSLCDMDCPPAFVLDKAFTYALKMQAEIAYQDMSREAIRFGGGTVDMGMSESNTVWMLQAAMWMKKAISADHRLVNYLRTGAKA